MAPLAGALTYHAGKTSTTIGVLSKYIPNEGDAWRYTVEAVRRFFEHVLTRREQRPDAIRPNVSLLEAVHQDLSPMAGEWIGSYLEAARQMGRRAGEMHVALGAITDDPAFAPEPFTPDYQQSTFHTARNWVYRVGQLLRRSIQSFNKAAQADAHLVLGREGHYPMSSQHCRPSYRRPPPLPRRFSAQQSTLTGKDFVVIDFEAKPARLPRRHKRSPLRRCKLVALQLLRGGIGNAGGTSARGGQAIVGRGLGSGSGGSLSRS